MAFDDAPQVDLNSKRSEESVIAVRQFFNQKTGFIFREEAPDYGVDVDVELIVNGKDASSWKFAIQIKSKKQLTCNIENGEELISFSFEVSRIGYLSKRIPAYGIIVLFDEAQQIGYFDYVEAIIARLDNHPNRTGWRGRESVTILVPKQILTKESVADIHLTMVNRHENNLKLIESYGKNFDIPYLSISRQSPGASDLNDPIQAGAFLTRFGTFMFNEQEYAKILLLLGQVNTVIINNSIELQFLAAITYTRTGNVIEAEYYLRKLERRKQELTAEQKAIILFSEVRVDFLKGSIDYPNFIKRLNTLSDQVEGTENQLIVRINKLFFKLNEAALSGILEIEVKDQIDDLTNTINTASLTDDQKHLMLVYHAENIHAFALEAFLHFNSSYKMSQSLNIEVPVNVRTAFARLSVSMLLEAQMLAFEAFQFSVKNEFYLLKASAAHNLGKFFYQTQYYLLMQGIDDEPKKDESKITEYRKNFAFSATAYNQFRQLQMQQNAHEALTNAYELKMLCKGMHFEDIGTATAEELLAGISALEQENHLPNFQSSALLLLESIVNRKSSTPTSIPQLTDEAITQMAQQALYLYKLPQERLVNMIAELKAIQLFESTCKNINIQLLTNNAHMQSKNTQYAYPPSFVLSHKQLQYQTPPNNDIHKLLEEFKHLLK